jgi:hypothetical protein
MSAPAAQWDQRVSDVGPGLAARRIYADLAAGAGSQMKLVDAANAAGLMPVISYKVGGDVSGAATGRYDDIAAQAAQKLAASGVPTAVTIWHEPYGDMSGDDYAAISRRLLPLFKNQGGIKVGPILNGWLLDSQTDVFASYCPDDLFEIWDYMGIDTYESGTAQAPGSHKPADRIPKLLSFLSSRQYATLPIGVGEYNGYSGATIAAMGDALLSTSNVWFGCMWNSDGGSKGTVLTGERLTAFKETLADSRSAEPRTV